MNNRTFKKKLKETMTQSSDIDSKVVRTLRDLENSTSLYGYEYRQWFWTRVVPTIFFIIVVLNIIFWLVILVWWLS